MKPVAVESGAPASAKEVEMNRNAWKTGGRLCVLAGLYCLLWLLALAAPLLDRAANASEMLLFEEPVVSAATKHLQAAGEAPSAVTVITREDIRRMGYRTLAEALRSVRGFYGSYDRNYEYVGVRGFLRLGDYNNRILVLINGHNYNDDVYGSGSLGTVFGIDMESIARIEVIRGPGSALYGAQALFAVINVVTVGAVEAPGVRALAETGSFWRKRGRVSIGHSFRNGLDIVASASVLDVDGHDQLYYAEYNSPETNNGLACDVDGDRAVNLFLNVAYHDFAFQAGYNHRRKEVPTGSFGVDFNDPDNQTTDSRSFAELTFQRDVLPSLGLTARAYYDGYYYDGDYIYEGVDNRDLAESYWFGGELRCRWEVFPGNALTAGVEAQYHPSARQKNFDDPTGDLYLDEDQSYDNWGVYLQDQWNLLSNLDLLAGFRYDRYYGRLGDWSPRVALIWRALQGSTVKLLYGQAFRPPSIYEQYYESLAGDPVELPNPDLDSETIATYEAVLEQQLPGRAEGSLSLYYYDIDGLIDLTSINDDTAIQFQNLQDVQAYGVELEVRVPIRDRFMLQGDYSYQDVRVEGRLLNNSPHHLGHARFLFPLPYGADGGVDLAVVGRRLTLARNHVSTAYPVNVTVNLPELYGFRVSASGYNLLNQTYDDPAGSEFIQERLEQDGATFRVQVKYAF